MKNGKKESDTPRGDPRKGKAKQPFWRVMTENVECLAIAIVMALMLKFFLIEAYKIPTGSMQPTIFGNAERSLFDRVLVNKFLYLLDPPERWDVIVFKYPLDQSKNYIKRLIGLPNEKVGIKNGDIYINDKIEKKPESTLGAVLKKIYPSGRKRNSFFDFFKVLEGEGKGLDNDGIVFSQPGSVATQSPITARYLDGYDSDYNIPHPKIVMNEDQVVGDVRLSFQVKIHEGDGGIEGRIQAEGREHVFFLRGEKSPEKSHVRTGPRSGKGAGGSSVLRIESDQFLKRDTLYEVAFTNIDDRLSIHLEGEEILALEYEDEAPHDDRRFNRIIFGSQGCGATFEEVRVYRDIYYTSGGSNSTAVEFQVPPGHYFALGDNTQNSADSRLWYCAQFTLKNEERIQGNYDPVHQGSPYHIANPQPHANGFTLTDIYGDERFIPLSALKSKSYERRPQHFIPEKLMLGKAMVVFWPVYPYFRWKLLR